MDKKELYRSNFLKIITLSKIFIRLYYLFFLTVQFLLNMLITKKIIILLKFLCK